MDDTSVQLLQSTDNIRHETEIDEQAGRHPDRQTKQHWQTLTTTSSLLCLFATKTSGASDLFIAFFIAYLVSVLIYIVIEQGRKTLARRW